MALPNGFSTINSYIVVKDAEKYIDFLTNAMDGKELGRTLQDNRIANSRVKIGESIVMISEASERFPATKSAFYCYVEDADAAYKRAIENGAESIMAPMDMPYGDRHSMLVDPAGNTWFPATRFDDAKFNS
jgi:PhnB protein